jgi:uncharacterized membrane protein
MTHLRENSSVTTPRMPPAREGAPEQVTHKFRHTRPPRLADERDGLNDRIASLIAQTVGSMWMFYISIIAFTIWMAGLGATVAGDHYPFNLMLLAVGGIMQWLAMIAILVAQNAQGSVQDKQVEHLHDLGMTTHRLVIENTSLTKAIHDHFIAADTESRPAR